MQNEPMLSERRCTEANDTKLPLVFELFSLQKWHITIFEARQSIFAGEREVTNFAHQQAVKCDVTAIDCRKMEGSPPLRLFQLAECRSDCEAARVVGVMHPHSCAL